MRKTRILLIGVPAPPDPKDDEEIEYPRTRKFGIGKFYYPLSLMDYNICMVDLARPRMRSLKEVLWGFSNEFKDFLDAGGVLVVYSGSPKFYKQYITAGGRLKKLKESFHTYGWLPVDLSGRTKAGKSVRFSKRNRIGKVLEDEDFVWKCVFDTDLPHDVVALNPARKTVGIEIPVSKGCVVLLPTHTDESSAQEVHRNILDVVKRDYIGRERRIPKPKWMKDYVLKGEEMAAKDLQEAQEVMNKFESAKGLLYLYDKDLTNAICTILSEIGYETRNLEMEGRHDVEIRYKDSFGLLEAKGLRRHARVDDLRQLSDHYSQLREEAEEKGEKIEVKGAFIVNHFREQLPSKRGDPFTGEAERIGKRDRFCLMTTVQLHQMYSDFISGKLKFRDIHKRIWETEGVLKDQ